jgi:hypothetical protein
MGAEAFGSMPGSKSRRIWWLMTIPLIVAAALLVSQPATAQGDVHVLWPAPPKGTLLNFNQPGFRLGDRLASRGPLVDPTDGTQVGYAYQDCVVMRQITDGPDGPGGLYRCSYLLHLDEGDLIVEGLDPHGPGTYTFAVMGGTGQFAGATGDATLTDSDAGTDLLINLIG